MPKFRCVRSLMSRPFWLPTSATVRPSKRADARPRAPCRRRGRGRRAARTSPRGAARRSRACTAGLRWRASSTERQISSSVGSAAMPVELALQPLELAREARAAQERQAAELAQLVAQPSSARASRRHCANEPQQLRAGTGRSSGRGTIASTWPKRRFDSARPKSSGSFSRVVCWTTRGPVNDSSAPGSATSTSPRLAKLASTPAGRRMRHHADQRAAGVVQVLDRADRLRQLHQREDPLLHARAARGRDRDERHAALRGALAGPRELLADDAAHRAAHEARSPSPRAGTAVSSIAARPITIASPSPVDDLRLGEPLGVRPQVEEVERVVRAQVGGLLHEAARRRRAARSARARAPGSGGRTAGRRRECCSSSSSR